MKSRIVQPAASFQPPETCTEHEECQAAQASPEDLRTVALEHYERVTTVAHEWHSVIPRAINAYFDNSSRDREIREVLEGLRDDGCFDACFLRWMKKYEDPSGFEHSRACLAARELYDQVQPVKEELDVVE